MSCPVDVISAIDNSLPTIGLIHWIMQVSGAMSVNLPRSDEATSDWLVAGFGSDFVSLGSLSNRTIP